MLPGQAMPDGTASSAVLGGWCHGTTCVSIRSVQHVDGFAFGLAHRANAAVLDVAFVLPQAAFASVLGLGCAYLMAKSNSIYLAILLHAS